MLWWITVNTWKDRGDGTPVDVKMRESRVRCLEESG